MRGRATLTRVAINRSLWRAMSTSGWWRCCRCRWEPRNYPFYRYRTCPAFLVPEYTFDSLTYSEKFDESVKKTQNTFVQ